MEEVAARRAEVDTAQAALAELVAAPVRKKSARQKLSSIRPRPGSTNCCRIQAARHRGASGEVERAKADVDRLEAEFTRQKTSTE